MSNVLYVTVLLPLSLSEKDLLSLISTKKELSVLSSLISSTRDSVPLILKRTRSQATQEDIMRCAVA